MVSKMVICDCLDSDFSLTVKLCDFFFSLSLNSSANKCLLKVATYAAQLEQYPKAIEIYEQVRWRIIKTILNLYFQDKHNMYPFL